MILTKTGQQRADQAVTLVELILSLALLMILAGAVVFSFSSLQSNRQLDEGLARLETLLGFARAHAAHSGQPVYLTLEASGEGIESVPRLQVKWEPRPFEEPGALMNLTVLPPIADTVNELVAVTVFTEPDTGLDDAASLLASNDSLSEVSFESGETSETQSGETTEIASFAFFPDGSSDSAKLLVTSRDPDDQRRFLLELVGLTGATRKKLLDENNIEILDEESLEAASTTEDSFMESGSADFVP